MKAMWGLSCTHFCRHLGNDYGRLHDMHCSLGFPQVLSSRVLECKITRFLTLQHYTLYYISYFLDIKCAHVVSIRYDFSSNNKSEMYTKLFLLNKYPLSRICNKRLFFQVRGINLQ